MNTLYSPRLNVVCKTQDSKTINKKSYPKYTTYKDLKLEINKNKPNNDKVKSLKNFFIKLFGEEIDYEKFNKESMWAIRVNKDKEDGTIKSKNTGKKW